MNKRELARYIDHTLLRPEATPEEIQKLCHEANQYDFATVCVNPCYVRLCRSLLHDSITKVCTVVGFPLGANATESKVFEARQAVEDGADEIDMVINIGKLKSRDFQYVEDEIRQVARAVGGQVAVKVILETCLLTEEEKVEACRLAKQAGAHFVKTSTGFSKAGATVADVALLRRCVGNDLGVKAAGGIRAFASARQMIEAGANRIGTSSGVKIVEECLEKSE